MHEGSDLEQLCLLNNVCCLKKKKKNFIVMKVFFFSLRCDKDRVLVRLILQPVVCNIVLNLDTLKEESIMIL